MRNARMDEAQLESRLPGKTSPTSDMQMIPLSWQKSKDKLKSLLRRVKKLAKNSTFKKVRSWHPGPSLHGKQMGKQWNQ